MCLVRENSQSCALLSFLLLSTLFPWLSLHTPLFPMHFPASFPCVHFPRLDLLGFWDELPYRPVEAVGDETGPAGLSAGYKLPASTSQQSVLGARPGHHSKTGSRKGLLWSGRRSCFPAARACDACASLLLAGRPSPGSN